MFSNVLDKKLLLELQKDNAIVEMLLGDEKEWFLNTALTELEESLNIDYTSLFLMNSMPIESSIIDDKDEVLVGLQNPVMQFYFEHGYELNLQRSHIQAPDHLSIECGFMQNLILKRDSGSKRIFRKTSAKLGAHVSFRDTNYGSNTFL